MGFISKVFQNQIVTKLTDVGRRKISQGNFKIKYFQIGDSDLDYSKMNENTFPYNNFNLIEPQPNSHNNTGAPESTKLGIKTPYYLSDNVNSITYGIPFEASSVDYVFDTAPNLGFFEKDTTCVSTSSQYRTISDDLNVVLSSTYYFITPYMGGTPNQKKLTISNQPSWFCGGINNSQVKDYFIILHLTNLTNYNTQCPCVNANTIVLTYKISDFGASYSLLDRKMPNLKDSFTFATNGNGRAFIYYKDINTKYSSQTPFTLVPESILNFESICIPETGHTKIWNMNIPWSESPAGITVKNFDKDYFGSQNYLSTKEYYGYTSNFGQIENNETYYYNSLKEKIIVLPEEQKTIAIIHYSNTNIVNILGEKFATEQTNTTNIAGLASNFKVVIPWIIWHKNSSANLSKGLSLYIDPPTFSSFELLQPYYIKSAKNSDMNEPGIRYYHLYDTNAAYTNGPPNRVGKVFPDDKIIIIDDEEIVAAMSYASNRNFTLPAPKIQHTNPKSDGGIIENENDCLWVTYLLSSDGIFDFMHCNYYQKITGFSSGCTLSSQNVKLSFGSEFVGMVQPTTSYTLDGFFAKKFFILAQKTNKNERPNSAKWKKIDFTSKVTKNAQGFISKSSLQSNNYTITKEIYENSPTYIISDYLDGLPLRSDTNDVRKSKIQFGDEFFFYGNVETDIQSTIYQMRYLINLPIGQFEKTSNSSWNTGKNKYMTEIGLYDDDKNLVAYSKFQSPQIRQGIQQAVVKLDF